MKIRILDEADADLRAGASFYQSQGDGLGDYFLDSIFSDIDSLQLMQAFMSGITGIIACSRTVSRMPSTTVCTVTA